MVLHQKVTIFLQTLEIPVLIHADSLNKQLCQILNTVNIQVDSNVHVNAFDVLRKRFCSL